MTCAMKLYTPDPAPVVADGKVWLFCDHDGGDGELLDLDCWQLKDGAMP